MPKKKVIVEPVWAGITGRPIIGVDPSLNGTAISIYHEQSPGGRDIILLSPRKDETELAKLARIYKFFSKAPEADYFIEDMAFNAKTFHTSAAMVQGIIRVSIALSGTSTINLVPPSTLKVFVTGSGLAKKEDMKLWIYKSWGEEFRTNDEADAYALMMIGCYSKGCSGLLTLSQKRRECLEKIKIYL